jgi:hypothetical protein
LPEGLSDCSCSSGFSGIAQRQNSVRMHPCRVRVLEVHVQGTLPGGGGIRADLPALDKMHAV